jgi:hypothetical protein
VEVPVPAALAVTDALVRSDPVTKATRRRGASVDSVTAMDLASGSSTQARPDPRATEALALVATAVALAVQEGARGPTRLLAVAAVAALSDHRMDPLVPFSWPSSLLL